MMTVCKRYKCRYRAELRAYASIRAEQGYGFKCTHIRPWKSKCYNMMMVDGRPEIEWRV